MQSRMRFFLYLLAASIITACISIAVTITVMNGKRGDEILLKSEEFQAYSQLAPLLELMELIENEQYGGNTTREQLVEGALRGALNAVGDPYAQYYTEEQYVRFLEQLDGAYHGIGALVGQPAEAGVQVLKVYADSPAAAAGLQAGDIITGIDGTALSGMTLEEIERLFIGDDGSVVTLALLRGADALTMDITRGMGTTQRVDYKLFNQYTGYIRLDKFSGTAVEEFSEALRDLTDRGMRSLVVDIRNNPGGDLEQVVAIADQLIADGIVVTVRQRNGEEQIYRSDKRCTTVPLAILVNENSASASEILAAAVQESGRGTVIGVTTYGKGVVQTTRALSSNGGWVKLTTAAYFTPNGNSVDGKGVTPNIEIDLTDDIKALPIDQIDTDDDAQLWAALDEVRARAEEEAA